MAVCVRTSSGREFPYLCTLTCTWHRSQMMCVVYGGEKRGGHCTRCGTTAESSAPGVPERRAGRAGRPQGDCRPQPCALSPHADLGSSLRAGALGATVGLQTPRSLRPCQLSAYFPAGSSHSPLLLEMTEARGGSQFEESPPTALSTQLGDLDRQRLQGCLEAAKVPSTVQAQASARLGKASSSTVGTQRQGPCRGQCRP